MGQETTFGQRLRDARVKAGLSQSGLEGRSGIPKARLSRYENGHVLPSIETLGRLASALGVPEASLLGDQRLLLDEFGAALFQRGLRLYSPEQAARLGHAVADILDTLCPGTDGSTAGPAASVASSTTGSVASSSAGPLTEAELPAEPVPPA